MAEIHDDGAVEPKSVKKRLVSPPSEESDSEDEYDYYEPRPPKKLPLKKTAQALFLLIIGLVFGVIGLKTLYMKGLSDAVPFLTISGIGLIPGGYFTVYIYLCWKDTPGFSYDQIPSYD